MEEPIDFSAIPERPTIRNSPEDRFFAMEVLSKAVEAMPQQQVECLALMLAGFTEQEIAHRVGLSERTAHEYLASAFEQIRTIASE